VDCAVWTTLKTAWLDLPCNLTQPGRMLSSFSWVRSASKARRAVASDLADQLDRDGAADRRSEIESEAGAARVIECRLQFDIGIALVRLAVVQRGRLPVIFTSPLT